MWNSFGNASEYNIASATKWVNGLTKSAAGGTDIYKALSAGFQTMGPSYPDSSAIFLLSDGEATSGVTNITQIAFDVRIDSFKPPKFHLRFTFLNLGFLQVKKWSHSTVPPIPVHTFSFTAGNIKDFDPSWTEDKEMSRLCMREIAAASDGVYHAYD